ncbi:hypothetical protein UlMin_025036, partial [Ulmus minor]
VPEYYVSLDEEGICRTAFELIFAFDEVISLGHKENVTVPQVKQYCEIESHEEKLHKLAMQSKINETKDVMKRKASKIDKSKIENNRGDKGGFMSSMGSGRIESGFSEMSISSSGSGFGSGSSLGLSTDFDSFSTKPKGHQPLVAIAPPKGLGMQLGEVILEDVQPRASQSRAVATPLTDPVTLSVGEKLNVTLKGDGEVCKFDVQGPCHFKFSTRMMGIFKFRYCISLLGTCMIETGENHSVLFKTHPNMNRQLFSNENILGARDPNRPFPTSQGGDGVGLLKWQMQSTDKSVVPLMINCWPSVSKNETYVSIEYESSSMFDFGSMEFVVRPEDSSMFFPISVRFSTGTHSVVNLLPQGKAPPKFSQRTSKFTKKV